MDQPQDRAVGSLRAWDAAVAVAFFLFGALVVWDSKRLGAEWASDGPQAGYFPFYIGMLICISSAANDRERPAETMHEASLRHFTGRLHLLYCGLISGLRSAPGCAPIR